MAGCRVQFGAIVAASTLLVACDWVVDGNGGDARTSETEPDLVLDPGDYADTPVSIRPSSDVEAMFGLYADLQDGLLLSWDIRARLDDQAGGESGTTACDGGGTATVHYSDTGEHYQEEWTLNDCVVTTDSEGDIRLSGTFSYDEQIVVDTAERYEEQAAEHYDIEGEIVASSDPVAMRGTIGSVSVNTYDSLGSLSGETDTFEIDGLEFQIGSQYIAITLGDESLREADGETEIDFNGKLIGSAIEGYIEVTTDKTIRWPDTEDCPIEGVVRIESDGDAELRLGDDTGSTRVAEIWVDGQAIETYSSCDELAFFFGGGSGGAL